MKTILACLSICSFLMFGIVSSALADGCYICSGGSYVKYSGSDDQSKRDAAKKCGCTVSGTRSSCDAANLTILCSVKADTTDETLKLAKTDQ